MKYMQGGELFHHLHQARRFSEELTRFYIIQIVLALGYLHKKNIIYRDLKPENILLDINGYIKIADMGLAKQMQPNQLTYTFAGTADYMAPEIITQKGYNFMSDWWSVGILAFELLIGTPPFYRKNREQMFQLIVNNSVQFPGTISLSS